MNKVYKVVWNNTLQCYTVVSELAKSHTKNNASKVVKATVLSSLLAVASSTYATQGGGTADNNTVNIDSEAIYSNANVSSINNGTLNFGSNLSVTGDSLITADNNSSINVGNKLTIITDRSVTKNEIVGIHNNSALTVEGDLFSSRDNGNINWDGDFQVTDNSKLSVKGNAEFAGNSLLHVKDGSEATIEGDLLINHNTDAYGENVVGTNSSLIVNGDLKVNAVSSNRSGKLFASSEGSSITVKGNTSVTDNAQLFAETYSIGAPGDNESKTKDEFKNVAKTLFEGNFDVTNNASLASFAAADVTVNGDLNASTGALIETRASGATLNVKGNAHISGNNTTIQAGNTGNDYIDGDLTLEDNAKINIYDKSSLNVSGALKATDSKVSVDNNSTLKVGGNATLVTNTDNSDWSSISNNSTLDVADNLTIDKTSIGINNSTVKVGKDLNLNFSSDITTDTLKSHMAYIEGSDISVEGNLNMDGQYVAGTSDNLDNDDDWNAYYKNRLVISKGGSSLDVKGDVNLKDNSHVKVESYWGEWGENASTEIPEFDKVTTAHVGGNVTLDNNSYLDSGHSAELTVDGNVTVKNGSQFGVWLTNDKAAIVKGNVKVTDANSKLETGNRAKTEIGGNLEVSDGGLANAWSQGNIKVAGNASFDSGMLKSEQNSIVSVGNDLSLTNSQATLADNGVLNVVGNFKAKGSYLDAKSTSLSVGKNLIADNSSLQVKDSTLTVNGNYEGVNTYLNANGKSAVSVDKDLIVSGKVETITGAFDGASLKVGGSATVSDLVRFTADRDASIEIGQDLNLNSTLSDASYSTRESAGIYNKSTMKVGGDVNVLSDSLLKADFDSSIEIDGDLNVKVDSHRNEIVGAYNNSSIKVKGSLNADRSSTFKENADINSGMNSTLEIAGNAKLTGNSKFNISDKSKVNVGGSLEFSRDAGNDVWTNLSSNSSLNVKGDFTSDKSSLSAYDNSSVNVGKNLTLTNTVDENHEIYLENSALNVNGDVTLKGLYKDHAYTTDEDTEGSYYRNKIFTSGVDASYKIGGDLNLLDNSNFGLETASNVPGDDPSDTIIKDNFEKVATGLVAGNVNVKNNSRFGVYQSAEATVNGDITATNGGIVSSFNSGAALTVKGDVNVTDKLSRLETGNIGSIDVGGKVAVENGATAYIGKKGTITASKGFSVNNATLEIENGKLVLSGEDAVLDLTQGGVLKTNEAGSINLSKGASVESLKETLLSDDTKTTAAGVAEKTFEADALSKVHLTNLGEVSLDEAQRLHGVLFNSETGILDLKINLDSDENGNVGFTDAIKVAGTTAAQDKTIADVDTSDKKLSDLTSSDLSWGSASLKDGQTDLDLGSGNLALNNPEANNGSFVSTADGTTGNITMDKDANLALNGNGAIGDVNTTENGTGDILIGNDKTGTVTANNLGSDDKAFGS